ncbi:hypothetical protein [Pseudobacteriovorax antillogorgiicola]|uniref:Cro/C1-type HTH DNA-binding domain-containing protein n=1 Tax=Pseudobacteriovorax antillogorgiicola TaxID=1513793 RepID=A0A1Y6CPJ1_9BACT|nr:hypothetical protein [Pseudobacteriovorax antillogorgiicola]TCS44219.1 hypothetical protein EDD56_13419 [Pseudobacteriovorax antillogorgiicola]SMF80491.1 hypothetical protein SAMN06296036_13520 [Pseudobacteriovorax antillogorgiicola]
MQLIEKIKSWKESHPSRSLAVLERRTNVSKESLSKLLNGKRQARLGTAITILVAICETRTEADEILRSDYEEFDALHNLSA